MSGLNIHQLSQFINHHVQILIDFGRRDFQRISRKIACQHHTVTVQNQTPVRDHRHNRDPVIFGLGGVHFMFDDLQPDKARKQRRKAEQNKSGDRKQPHPEVIQFAFGVFKFGHSQ